ncbi:GDSL-type esterase/lipase family protein [Pedobacter cryoconitis]|uniref:Lysophospholipase L1-like esterase n=1 Tax=Pedobacter cryoconitis TaxID=188932 RepID=A0A7X0J0C1_9SPHI|nr:GDSL-type esterase/lipase family protein [Pedobacter cryoconitis]MBB6498726.1 lysophospholipase L1-like esterase [Pedobacter cryoconitis]
MLKVFKTAALGSAFLLLFNFNSFSQDKPAFWNDIQTIKAYDQIYAPPKNPILFIGSSSIRLWVDFNKAFKDYTVLNRGIGGAVTADVDRYLEDIVFPYHPKQLVIYVGENDLIQAPDGDAVFQDFKKMYTDIRARLPVIPIVYLAIKASPSRAKYLEKGKRANLLVQQFLKGEQNTTFIDVYQPMLDSKGDMQPKLFKEDMLHMNATGYQIWNKLLIPNLLKSKE